MIHILRCALMESDPGLERFDRAGRELCKFSHDAFPEVVDYGRFMVRPYIVTEVIEGRTLAELIEAGELGSDRALRIINDTRDALLTAHKAGMAHGALGPDSLMITPDGEVKILDLFSRWMCHQINTKGGEIDTAAAADLHALVELSQRMMKGARRVTKIEEPKALPEAHAIAETSADLASDLEINGIHLPKKIFEKDTADLNPPPPTVLALAEEETKAPPPTIDQKEEQRAAPVLWEEFTPEPEVEMGGPPPTVVAVPPRELPPAPQPIVFAPKPAPMAPPPPQHGIKVRLPPPPVSTNATQPKPAPSFAVAQQAPIVRMPPATRTPIQVKLPAPMTPVKTAPPPKPRVSSFVPTATIDFSDDPLLSPQLQPGYIEFFKRLFPRARLTPSAIEGAENGASRSLNLLLTCSVALLMLAAVLRF